MVGSKEAQLLLYSSRLKSDRENCQAIARLCQSDLDWTWIAEMAVQNRVAPLIYTNLQASEVASLVAPGILRKLETAYYHGLALSTNGKQVAQEILPRFNLENIPTILLRGVALGERIYHDPALRPFSDTDLLIRRVDLRRARQVMSEMGYVPHAWTLDTSYFEGYHLHLLLHKRNNVIELHWALDHKYTIFTIDYEEIFSEAIRGQLAGTDSALLMSPEDLLLSLSIHLAKHCYYIKYGLAISELLEWILSDGFLILYCDIAETIRHFGPALDWERLISKARRWQTESVLYYALSLTHQLLGAPIASGALQNLQPYRVGRLEKAIFTSTAGVAKQSHKMVSSYPYQVRELVQFQPASMFRPARTLDLFMYLWPPAQYLKTRYRARNIIQVGLYRGFHSARAFLEIFSNLFALVRYSWFDRHFP